MVFSENCICAKTVVAPTIKAATPSSVGIKPDSLMRDCATACSMANAAEVGQNGHRLHVAQAEPAVDDAVQAAPLELAQALVGVHQRQSQAVGDMLLRQRKCNTTGARVGLQRGGALERSS